MGFFISDAWAQGGGGESNLLFQLAPLVIIFAIFYFLLIRPQAKRAKDHKKMVADLAKGDEAVTNGGLLGKISEIGDNFVALEVAASTTVKVQRSAIASVVPKGTIKSL